MKKIFLSIPYGMSARNFLRSDVLKTLKNEAEVIISTPLGTDPQFRAEFEGPNVRIVSVPRKRSLPLKAVMQLLFVLETWEFTRRNPIETMVMLKNQLRGDAPLKYAAYAVWAAVGRWLPFVPRGLRALYERLSLNPGMVEVLKEAKPDLVFSTHGYVQEETETAIAAKRLGIPVVCMLHSWDNVTSKSGIRQLTSPTVGRVLQTHLYDAIVVWNGVLADELVELYGYPRGRIFLSGIPQFDDYVNRAHMERDAFFRLLGADPAKKLIYFIATSTALIRDQTVAVKALVDAMKSGRFGAPCQLVIRLHPRSDTKIDMNSWPEQFAAPGVFFQKPGAAYVANVMAKGWEPASIGADDLAETIYHCDVLINGMSTTAIDAAMNKKPVICFAFDGDEANGRLIPAYYNNTHYKKLLERGGIRVSWSAEEMIAQVNAYLENPSLDAEGRERIRQEYGHRVDGKSGERIARYLLERAGATAPVAAR